MRNVRVVTVLLGQDVSAQVVSVEDDVTYAGVLEKAGVTFDPETMVLQEIDNDGQFDFYGANDPDSGCPNSDSTLVIFEKTMFDSIPNDEGEEAAPDPEPEPGKQEGEEAAPEKTE